MVFADVKSFKILQQQNILYLPMFQNKKKSVTHYWKALYIVYCVHIIYHRCVFCKMAQEHPCLRSNPTILCIITA